MVPVPRAAEGSQVNTAHERRQEVAWHWSGKTSRRLLRKQYCIIVTINNSPFFEPCWDNAPNKAERKKQSLPGGLVIYQGWRRRKMHGEKLWGGAGLGLTAAGGKIGRCPQPHCAPLFALLQEHRVSRPSFLVCFAGSEPHENKEKREPS